MLFDKRFIKTYNTSIEQALELYSIELKAYLESYFEKQDAQYYTLREDFYRFQIFMRDINVKTFMSNDILYPWGGVPDGVIIKSLVDDNSFYFTNLDLTVSLSKNECLIFPYGETYNIKETRDYYGAVFSQR